MLKPIPSPFTERVFDQRIIPHKTVCKHTLVQYDVTIAISAFMLYSFNVAARFLL